jgi:hypothetical protein
LLYQSRFVFLFLFVFSAFFPSLFFHLMCCCWSLDVDVDVDVDVIWAWFAVDVDCRYVCQFRCQDRACLPIPFHATFMLSDAEWLIHGVFRFFTMAVFLCPVMMMMMVVMVMSHYTPRLRDMSSSPRLSSPLLD